MFIKLITIILVLSFLPNLVFGSSYENYKLTPLNEKTLASVQDIVTSTLNLVPLNNIKTGGIEIFGVNQMFVSYDFSQFLIFKYNVVGNITLNTWEDVGSGKLYHYQSNGKVNAVFIKGISTHLADIIINRIKTIFISRAKFRLSFINSAFAASECNIKQLPIEHFPTITKLSESMIFQSLLSCGTGISNSGVQAWNGIEEIANTSISDLFTSAKKTLGNFYDGVINGALIVKDIYIFVAQFITNPNLAVEKFKAKYGEAADAIIPIFEQLLNLPGTLMIEMACSTITGIGIDALIGILSGGATALKAALSIKSLAQQSIILGKIFSSISYLFNAGKTGLKFTKDKLTSFTRKLMRGEIDEEDLELLMKRFSQKNHGSIESTLNGMACFI